MTVEGRGEGSSKGGGDLEGEGERRGREKKQQDQDSHFQAHVYMDGAHIHGVLKAVAHNTSVSI